MHTFRKLPMMAPNTANSVAKYHGNWALICCSVSKMAEAGYRRLARAASQAVRMTDALIVSPVQISSARAP